MLTGGCCTGAGPGDLLSTGPDVLHPNTAIIIKIMQARADIQLINKLLPSGKKRDHILLRINIIMRALILHINSLGIDDEILSVGALCYHAFDNQGFHFLNLTCAL
jgi:hypothetical protein